MEVDEVGTSQNSTYTSAQFDADYAEVILNFNWDFRNGNFFKILMSFIEVTIIGLRKES